MASYFSDLLIYPEAVIILKFRLSLSNAYIFEVFAFSQIKKVNLLFHILYFLKPHFELHALFRFTEFIYIQIINSINIAIVMELFKHFKNIKNILKI